MLIPRQLCGGGVILKTNICEVSKVDSGGTGIVIGGGGSGGGRAPERPQFKGVFDED